MEARGASVGHECWLLQQVAAGTQAAGGVVETFVMVPAAGGGRDPAGF